jgi:hypothetical protein
MKMKLSILISLIITCCSALTSFAQCNAEELCNLCVPKLPAGFNFLKSYKLIGNSGSDQIEYSYVFAKGTQYMINLCEEKAGSTTITLTIYDAQRNKVATNRFDGALMSAIAYPCNATGIYYLQYRFENAAPRCGCSILAFKR